MTCVSGCNNAAEVEEEAEGAAELVWALLEERGERRLLL